MKNEILIIDGSIWLYRNSIALKPLYNTDFIDISVVFYTLKKLYDTIEKYKPSEVHIVFDIGRDIRKKQLYDKYKENRNVRKIFKDTLLENNVYERLEFSRKLIYEILLTTPINVYLYPFIEGDTLIAYIANNYKDKYKLIISTDKDMYQLIDNNTNIIEYNYNTKIDEIINKDDYDLIWEKVVGKYVGLEKLLNKFSELNLISFKSIPYYRAFLGDVSDNIPGIKYITPEIISYLIQFQQYKNKIIFNDCDDFLDFFIKNKDELINNYTKINKIIYNKNKKSVKKINLFFEKINNEDVISDWKLFFNLMDFDYSINNIPSSVLYTINEQLNNEKEYKRNEFLNYIIKYDLNSITDYIVWDIINNILYTHDENLWNMISSQMININNFDILFKNLVSSCSFK